MNTRAQDLRLDFLDLATAAGVLANRLRALTSEEFQALRDEVMRLPDDGPPASVLHDVAAAAQAACENADFPRLKAAGLAADAAASVVVSMGPRSVVGLMLLGEFQSSEPGLLGFADGLTRAARTAADALSRPHSS